MVMPLERDEGEFAYAGQLIRQGIPPYELIYNIKLPGTYAAYALIMSVFGETITGIRLGLLAVNLAAILLLFFFVKRLFDAPAAIIACATYAYMSLSHAVLGFAAHATHFVVVAALGGLILLLRGIESGKLRPLFWSGFLFGTAFLLKQPGILFGVFGGVWLIGVSKWREREERIRVLKRIAALSLGAMMPYGLTCLILWRAGVFEKFWRWTVTYAGGHSVPLRMGLENLVNYFKDITAQNNYLWLLAAAALLFLPWAKTVSRPKKFFVTGLFLASFLAVCPGFYFSEHYFVLMLPAVALAIGAGVSVGRQMLGATRPGRFLAHLPTAIFVLIFAWVLTVDRLYLFQFPPMAIFSSIYFLNPFEEALKVSDYIRAHSTPESRVAVLGSEPEIYFYAQRRSATGYIYGYDLMLEHKHAIEMQREMIREIEAARPEYVVLVNNIRSWTVWPKSDKIIFKWGNAYAAKFYDLVGIVDQNIVNEQQTGETIYRWDSETKDYPVRSNYFILVYKRKPGA